MTRRTHSLAAIATLLLAAPVISACSSGAKPETAAAGFLHALGDQKADVACKFMTTDDGTKPLEQDAKQLTECTDSFTKLMATMKDTDKSQAKAVTIAGSTINGDKATITSDQIKGMDKAPDISMVKFDGKWYIDSKALNAN